jgi:hypothetical protein
MKITLWQQFNSNHSASFTVVGMFDTPDSAEQAEKALQTMLTAIEGWHRGKKGSYPLAIQGKKAQPREDLTPPEYHFAEQYQIEWPRPVGWITKHDPGDLTLSRMDHVVFLSSFNFAFQGPQPFDEIMAKLGGQVTVQAHSCDDYGDTLVVLNLSCTAPDPAQAEWIDLIFQDYRDSTVTRHAFYEWIDKFQDTDDYWPKGIVYNQTERDGARLDFRNVAIHDVQYVRNFIQYLENEGCSDFRFEFHYVSEDV